MLKLTMGRFSYKKISNGLKKSLCCAFAAVTFAAGGVAAADIPAGKIPAHAKVAHAAKLDNATRPDHLAGYVILPATSHFPQKRYNAGSGGINEKFPSLPYGTHLITGTHHSPIIEYLTGDPDVFDIQSMPDKKVGRMRVRMAFHKATREELVSMGCVAVKQDQYLSFKKHMSEALNEHPELVVTLAPPKDGQTALFRVKPRG